MTKSIKLALVAAMAMGATSAFATNGDNLIGLGAKSRAMGGTGIAHFNGAESATSNPALITKSSGTNFAFGGTYFRPNVEVKTEDRTTTQMGAGAPNGVSGGTYKSEAKHNVIPYVALTENLDNGFAVGASMFGSAGMGTDWRHAPANINLLDGNGPDDTFGLYSMRSNLLLLKFSIPLAYGQDNWSVGIAPVLMYGSLDMSFKTPGVDSGVAGATTGTGFPDGSLVNHGNGSSASFGLGLEVGAAYTLPDMGVTLGATYHSSIEMEYKDQISTSAAAFGFVGANAFNDKLEQPAEYGLGIDWTEGDISVTADWKNIRWGNARGYQDFGWENQNVYALGAEYRMDDLALRAGYNYAKNPIKTTDGSGLGGSMNTLNHVMFPAVTERHYTIGAGYQFTKNVGADLAVTYATSPDVTAISGGSGLGTITVTNDQFALSANLNYSF